MVTWLCPKDCKFSSGPYGPQDNPVPWSCHREDEWPEEVDTFEETGNFPRCKFYQREPEYYEGAK